MGETIPSDFIKNHKGEVKRNFINFKVSNFRVDEIGSAEQMYNQLDAQPKEDEEFEKKSKKIEEESPSPF